MIDLSSNKLTSLDDLENFRFAKLYVLKLGQNLIKHISGVSHMFQLRDLDLSSNRIKMINE